MGRFVNRHGVTFSVDDSKDEQYQQAGGYETESAEKSSAKGSSSKSSTDK